jgi:hypothetical protein
MARSQGGRAEGQTDSRNTRAVHRRASLRAPQDHVPRGVTSSLRHGCIVGRRLTLDDRRRAGPSGRGCSRACGDDDEQHFFKGRHRTQRVLRHRLVVRAAVLQSDAVPQPAHGEEVAHRSRRGETRSQYLDQSWGRAARRGSRGAQRTHTCRGR